ncbi:MAG: hypothetical protein ACO3A2_08245 [Bdellovibrionia bacterium]
MLDFKRLLMAFSLSLIFVEIAGCGQAPQVWSSANLAAPVQIPTPSSNLTLGSSTPTTTAASGDPFTVTVPASFNYNFKIPEINNVDCSTFTTSSTLAQLSTTSATTYETIAVPTDNLFKVKVSASPPSVIPCRGEIANYSCLQFDVTVGSKTLTAKVSYGNPSTGPCAGVPNSVTLDFSDQASPGHGDLKVKVSKPMYDNCRLYGQQTQLYYPWVSPVSIWGCPMSSKYPSHIVSGSIAITTNLRY